jgi:hypothetical protein
LGDLFFRHQLLHQMINSSQYNFSQLILIMPQMIREFEPPLEESNSVQSSASLNVLLEKLLLYFFRDQKKFDA